MRDLATNALLSGGLLGLVVVMLAVGNAMELAGVKNLGVFTVPVAVVFFGTLLAFGFSAIPLMLKLVLSVQIWLGNENVPPIRAAIANERWIVISIWAVMALGCAVAIPAALWNTFGSGSHAAADAIARMPVEGTLVAAPGMTVEAVARASSLKLSAGSRSPLFDRAVLGGAAIFDFRVAGTGVVFERCRYYYITTSSRDRRRVEAINVGTSPGAASMASVEGLNAALRAKLARDGWLAGYEVYATAEDRRLHGGLTHGKKGRLWLKNGIVLDIETNRVDDPVPAENAAAAGRWIQYVDLRLRSDYPWIGRYTFARR